MTVKELKKLLAKYDDNLEVLGADHDGWFYDYEGVQILKIHDGQENDKKGVKCLCLVPDWMLDE